MADFPGIPGYKIISKLGEGGMAAVYLGTQEKLNRKVAIKILEPSLLKDEETRLRFEREARTAASLSNSNIIRIFDTGKQDDYYYIAMEYLDESLRDRMGHYPDGKMDPGIALRIIESLMGALDYLHFRGIHHRDIKPENIMFRQDDTPVLVDFGIARAVDNTDGKDLTVGNIVPGSPNYMSPEQCKAQKMDWRSDIYSLGVVFYELLTGKKPFDDNTSIGIILKHIQSPIPRLTEELSRYQPLIDKMLAKDRKKRISTTPGFYKLLKTIGIAPRISTSPAGETSPIPTPGKTERKPITLFPLREEQRSPWQKVTDSLESFAIKCLDLFTGKVLPFLRDMKKKVE